MERVCVAGVQRFAVKQIKEKPIARVFFFWGGDAIYILRHTTYVTPFSLSRLSVSCPFPSAITRLIEAWMVPNKSFKKKVSVKSYRLNIQIEFCYFTTGVGFRNPWFPTKQLFSVIMWYKRLAERYNLTQYSGFELGGSAQQVFQPVLQATVQCDAISRERIVYYNKRRLLRL